MAENKLSGFATRAVRSGQQHDPETLAHATPIYQTSTFVLGSMARGADLFAGAASGNVYSRIGNPTVRAVEEKIAALEGTEEAVAFASGMGGIAGGVDHPGQQHGISGLQRGQIYLGKRCL